MVAPTRPITNTPAKRSLLPKPSTSAKAGSIDMTIVKNMLAQKTGLKRQASFSSPSSKKVRTTPTDDDDEIPPEFFDEDVENGLEEFSGQYVTNGGKKVEKKKSAGGAKKTPINLFYNPNAEKVNLCSANEAPFPEMSIQLNRNFFLETG